MPATPSWRWRLVRMYPKRVMRSGYVLSAPAAIRKYHPSGVRNNRGFRPLLCLETGYPVACERRRERLQHTSGQSLLWVFPGFCEFGGGCRRPDHVPVPGMWVPRRAVGQPPSHHVPAVPVHDGHQVEECPGHGQVGDVGGPRLVEPGDPAVPQQVGIDPMLRPTRVGEVAQFWRYLSRSAGCSRYTGLCG